MSDLGEIRDRMREFSRERDWDQFHDPKSLLLALVGEVGELTELFQWIPAADAQEQGSQDPLRTRAAEEMSDVLIYLVRLADILGIDLADAAQSKLSEAARRFPPQDFQGTAPPKR